MANQTLTVGQAAQLHHLLASIGEKHTAKALTANAAETPCDIYKKDIKPVIDEALPWIKLIPEWGAEIAAALQTIENVADQICPA